MAKKDNIKLLGKRVGYWSDEFKDDEGYVILPSRFFTGLVVAVVVQWKAMRQWLVMMFLLLQDGNDEPDFVSGEYDFDLLD